MLHLKYHNTWNRIPLFCLTNELFHALVNSEEMCCQIVNFKMSISILEEVYNFKFEWFKEGTYLVKWTKENYVDGQLINI